MRGITADEEDLLTHWSRFGSDGYPIKRLGRGWHWSYKKIKSPPTIFRTKREAVASFEAFIDVLLDAKARRI